MNHVIKSSILLAFLVATGCGKDDAKPKGDEPRFSIRVSPLQLSDIVEVKYKITVKRKGGEVVWSQSDLRSTDYGDGAGALNYIGPCDGSVGANPHTVELVIQSVTESGGSEAAFQNPAPEGKPLAQEAVCQPNGDTRVDFDVTILREANQGFFDIGVNFSEIYCSAKFDCEKDTGDPIELLFNHGVRDRTLVLGFACTTGAGSPTWLHVSSAQVECTDPEGPPPQPVVREVVPLGQGNLGPVLPFFFETASYQGTEALVPYDKCYWNMAFGILEGASTKNCRLKVTGTASDESWKANAGWSPPKAIYPYIEWNIPITGSEGTVICEQDPLNGKLSHVTTQYTDFGGGKFTHEWRCGADIVTTEKVSCGGTIDGLGYAASFTQTPLGVTVAFGGEPPSQQFKLPPEYGEVEDCCFNACCTDP